MARSWLVDGRGLATKVKNATLPATCQIKDCGANRECPNCRHIIDNSDVSHEWPGFPVGVKFEPSDAELIEHLAAKCGVGNVKAHKLIDVFIPTLDGDDGIYYAHPENLPGAKKDGSSVYFFYRTVNAYATGQRKRRKIQAQDGPTFEQVRWHKTGKTKIVRESGVQRGCKKIMVLYGTSKRGCKPDKSNWVMHQYHLGSDEEEKEGEYVVSRIYYQQSKLNDESEPQPAVKNEEYDASRTSPRTPKTVLPEPPRTVATPSVEDVEFVDAGLNAFSSGAQLKDELDYTALFEETEAPDLNGIGDFLLCDENIYSSTISNDVGQNGSHFTGNPGNTNAAPQGELGPSSSGVAELENLEIDSQPDYLLSQDLYFGSQDSFCSWMDRL